MTSPRISLLGIPIDTLTMKQLLPKLRRMIGHKGFHHVITVNNEMLVDAQSRPGFFKLLQRTTLNIPDSTGLLFGAKLTGQHLPERCPGVDTMQQLCATLHEKHPVFLLGAAEGVAEQAAAILQQQNPKLKIAGTYSGSSHDIDAQLIVDRINASGAHVLFVAFGAPRQDMWIDAHHKKMPKIRLAMGVGGSFDFIAGTIQRAPAWLRRLGLEWLWRFWLQPSRWRRMWRATVVFVWMVLRYGKRSSL